MVVLVIVLVVVAALVIFSVQNANPVAVSFLVWHFNASLAIVVFLSLVAGVIAMALVSLFTRWRRSVRRSTREDATAPSVGESPTNSSSTPGHRP